VRRIICLGNPLFARDDAGPRVFGLLSGRSLPEGVEVIDGGLGGLGLLRLLEGACRVVFVDSAEGLAPEGCDVMTLDPARVAALASGTFDHAAGLPYLLRALPLVLDAPAPSIAIVGIQGAPCDDALERAAELALRLVVEPASGGGAEVSP
jgi:hydrogenase maturation protease